MPAINIKELPVISRYRRFRQRYVPRLPRYQIITDLTPPADVLDFGCGEGHLGKMLQEKGCRVVGCDISTEFLTKCSFPTFELDLNERTHFEDNQFETVVASDVLEHLRDTEAALREMQRIARRFVIISVPNSKDFFLYKLFPSLENPQERYSPHLHHWNRETFPKSSMTLLDFVYCTDFPEFRIFNRLQAGLLSQTMVMKFAVPDGQERRK
jgi:methionine biosynthesis protein MetW